MLSKLQIDSRQNKGAQGGFLTRDLIRFFIVDIILIIGTKLLIGIGFFTRPDTHVAFILGGKVILLLYLIWLVRDRREAWPETGAASAGTWWAWPAAIGFYALAYPAIIYVERLNRIVMPVVHDWLGLVYTPSPQDVMILLFEDILHTPVRIVLAVFVVVVGPFMEELAFRGIGIDAYRRSGGIAWALAMTSILFGLYHFSLHLILPLTFLGLVFGIVRVFSRTLWCSVLVHCLHNGLTLALMANELGLLDTFIQGGT